MNILIASSEPNKFIIRLADFGSARIQDSKIIQTVGTVQWMAPEILLNKGQYNEKVDVYSFGIVVWEIITMSKPYAEMPNDQPIISKIQQHVKNNGRLLIPSLVPATWREIMESAWNGTPEDRPQMAELFESILDDDVEWLQALDNERASQKNHL
eukprot:TRINITY_DN2343_c0_g1_i1.p1 TRINITY_DN2343_c0_g1~~TRINITY_DN2343_c0_g1_i1.p1  ORF type:complete len:155 (-),score=20.36 TRINITY_DN2343_c0_g1_i1:52-516(-)